MGMSTRKLPGGRGRSQWKLFLLETWEEVCQSLRASILETRLFKNSGCISIHLPIRYIMKSLLINMRPSIKFTILLLVSAVAALSRVFAVIRFESIIHEFDPWFNYRATQHMVDHDFDFFWNWFDSQSWYPLGRDVGGTVYPGLMSSAGFIYFILRKLAIPVDIREVCVFIGPIFSIFTSLSTYLLVKEVSRKEGAGLLASLLISVLPSFMSRSHSGGYDNQSVAIFAMIMTFYLFLRTCNTGSIWWGLLSSLSMFYMVASWGGYSFIINIIPLYVLGMLVLGRLDSKMYVAYSIFYTFSTIMAMQIKFVRFLAVQSSEHMISHGVFLILQAYFFSQHLKSKYEAFKKYFATFFLVIIGLLYGVLFIYLLYSGKTYFTGRSMTLIDPTYAKKYIPIIASVAEHSAPDLKTFFAFFHIIHILAPLGIYKIYKAGHKNCSVMFLGFYLLLAVYFSGIMSRLSLILGPAEVAAAAIGVSWIISKAFKSLRFGSPKRHMSPLIGLCLLVGLLGGLYLFVNFSVLMAAESFSDPSVVIQSKRRDGSRLIIDDYRQAYYWLRVNSKPDQIVMSWWDYGYQITGFSNRTTLVDNNTWNNTHIATVGLSMASSEEEAYEICQRHDVDYVLVISGALSGYSGDDINKFYWMVMIGGGVYPHIKMQNYFEGGMRLDDAASSHMKNSLMFRLSNYKLEHTQNKGYDVNRRQQVSHVGKLTHFEEAFSSNYWIVRLFRRKRANSRGRIRISMKEKTQSNMTIPAEMLQRFKYAQISDIQ